MKKIAVWGYGAFGQKMLQSIETYWKQELEVTRIYDKRCDSISDPSGRVKSPAEAQKDYQEGLFEAVMIAVNYSDAYIQIRRQLRQWGIPVFELGKEEDYCSGALFRQETDPPVRPEQDGYVFFTFRDLLGAAGCVSTEDVMYLFDESGRSLEEHWDTYWVKEHYTHQFDYPVRMDAPDLCPVRMPGDYCILAKLWSHNYGHFLFESMDCVQLMEEAGFTGKYVINNRAYNRDVLRLYGIEDSRILTVRDFEFGRAYSFERVYYPKLLNNDQRKAAPVLGRMAAHMKENLSLDRERYPSRLYVERSGFRKLLFNEGILEKYGFVTINPDRLPVQEQMMYFYNADLVLAPHGANTANSLYMRSDTVLIETFGRNWVKYYDFHAARENGVFYIPVVEGPILPNMKDISSEPFIDYYIPDEFLENAIEIALRVVNN